MPKCDICGHQTDRQREAHREFIAASVAVWQEIDRLSVAPEGYSGLEQSTELRQRERQAWEQFRDAFGLRLAGTPPKQREDSRG